MSTPLLVHALAPIGGAALAAAGWCGLRLRRTVARTSVREAELLQRVAELEQECEELQRTAACDPLTGVWNYRHLQLTLDREIERSRRAEQTEGRPRQLALLMLEIAGFDAIVAEHGRGRGNAILRDLVQRLSIEIRRSDTFGRYGGEEFLVLLPDTGAEGAAQVAERLCWAVRRHQLLDWSPAGPAPRRSTGNGLTAAVGVAVLPRDGGHAALLLRAADRALAEARAAGGDRWCGGAGPDDPTPAVREETAREDEETAREDEDAAHERSAPAPGVNGAIVHEGVAGERAARVRELPAEPGGTPTVDATVAQPPRSPHPIVPDRPDGPGSVATCADEDSLASAGASRATATGAARDTVS
ncbi:diguanylate cyclase [Kitasatospora sp. NPDC048540]|uniref:GGDEF domain-containing protein n=1 Tax=unclassified Kitasatospora TaxID=2633591 RepID=UPI0006924DB7|nr:GGDEF domain-containing protein [Kitasatospora sp. MBT63]